MKRDKIIHIDLPIYRSTISVIYTDDMVNARNKLGDIYPLLERLEIDEQEEAIFIYHDEMIGKYFIIFNKKPSLDTIVHEVIHATFRVLIDHGVKYDVDNDEAFTYLAGYLTDRIYKKK